MEVGVALAEELDEKPVFTSRLMLIYGFDNWNFTRCGACAILFGKRIVHKLATTNTRRRKFNINLYLNILDIRFKTNISILYSPPFVKTFSRVIIMCKNKFVYESGSW